MKKYEINILASPNCKVFKSCTYTEHRMVGKSQSSVKGNNQAKSKLFEKKNSSAFFHAGIDCTSCNFHQKRLDAQILNQDPKNPQSTSSFF